jgi:prepilin-type N-terminal cleavage/methylation domain-containing protein
LVLFINKAGSKIYKIGEIDMALQSKRILQRVVGFSLIELMIVVAIIGILASIAIPSYEGYVARAKLTHLMAFSDEVRKKVAEHRAVNGVFPVGDSANTDYIGKILSVPSDPYIAGTNIATAVGTDVGLVIKVDGDNAYYSIIGKKSGFPGGDPIIQLIGTYTKASATTSAKLSWSCKGGMISGTAAVKVEAGAANFYSETCPADQDNALTNLN